MRHAGMLTWNETVQFAQISLYLKGKALRVYDQAMATRTGNTPTTEIAGVFACLIAGCAQSSSELLYQFQNRTRHSNESLGQFARALQDLLARAVPDQTETRLHLPAHLKALIEFNSDKTWDSLLSCLDKSYPHVLEHEGKEESFNPLIKQELETNYTHAQQNSGSKSTRFSNNNNNNNRSNNYNNIIIIITRVITAIVIVFQANADTVK